MLVRDRVTFRHEGRTLEDRSKVDGRAKSDSLRVVALFEVSVDPADGELRGKRGGSWSGRVRVEVETDKGGDRSDKERAKRTWRPALTDLEMGAARSPDSPDENLPDFPTMVA